jgi:hypothetical protein
VTRCGGAVSGRPRRFTRPGTAAAGCRGPCRSSRARTRRRGRS